MSENIPHSESQKLSPESLVLRGQPRRVVRFKRNLMVGLAAAGCIGVIGAAWAALQTPAARRQANGDELYSIDRKVTPDGLASLPGRYDQIKPAAASEPPVIGPPLPGDLGPPIVREEKSLGVAPATGTPSPDEQAEQAEKMRMAQQARQAAQAGVFFQLSRQEEPAKAVTPVSDKKDPGQGIGSSPTKPRLNLDPVRDQNDQQRKLDFVNAKQDERAIYNPHVLQTPASPYEVLAGTVVAASLITGINSDLPGLVTAQVTENIYDTVTGRVLLIPQGARLIGSYDSVVAFNQSRALLVWQRIIMPDGSSIVIDNLPASDKAGYSGLSDQVDYHTWALLKGVALSTLLGAGGQLTFGNDQSDLVQAIRQSTQENTNQAGQKIVEKDLNIQPTLTIRPGWPLRVVVHKDLILRPYRNQGASLP